MLDVYVGTATKQNHVEAQKVLMLFQELVARYELEEQVSIIEAGNLGGSASGVVVHVGGCLYTGVTMKNAEFVFEEYVLDLIQNSAS